jgi:hypothetical protein
MDGLLPEMATRRYPNAKVTFENVTLFDRVRSSSLTQRSRAGTSRESHGETRLKARQAVKC